MTFYHVLKLFQPQTDPTAIANPDGSAPPNLILDPKKRLISEFYDEIVFNEPSQMMQQLLTNTQRITNGPWTHDTDCKQKRIT